MHFVFACVFMLHLASHFWGTQHTTAPSRLCEHRVYISFMQANWPLLVMFKQHAMSCIIAQEVKFIFWHTHNLLCMYYYCNGLSAIQLSQFVFIYVCSEHERDLIYSYYKLNNVHVHNFSLKINTLSHLCIIFIAQPLWLMSYSTYE